MIHWKRLHLWLGVAILATASGIGVHAQGQTSNHRYGQWLMYFGDNRINDKIGIHTEAQFRDYLLTESNEQLLLRTGLNWYLDPSVMLTAGYGYIYTEPQGASNEGVTTREHRIWQQMIFRQHARSVFLEHRYRLEQRFIDNLSTGEEVLAHRIRYRLFVSVPLTFISKKMDRYFLAGYNELFVHLGRRNPAQYFDRNRLYFALGYRVNPNLNFQLGYLNQVISLPGTDVPEVNHNLQVSVFFNVNDVMHPFKKPRP